MYRKVNHELAPTRGSKRESDKNMIDILHTPWAKIIVYKIIFYQFFGQKETFAYEAIPLNLPSKEPNPYRHLQLPNPVHGLICHRLNQPNQRVQVFDSRFIRDTESPHQLIRHLMFDNRQHTCFPLFQSTLMWRSKNDFIPCFE